MLTGYLAGPIENVTIEEACKWRNDIKQYFKGIILMHDPMYAETVALRDAQKKGSEQVENAGFLLKADSIFHRDKMMINNSDFILVNLMGQPCSIGTGWEMGYAYGKDKTVIVVSGETKTLEHPFVFCPAVTFTNMRDARKYLITIAQDFY